jgi:hypothetical protein
MPRVSVHADGSEKPELCIGVSYLKFFESKDESAFGFVRTDQILRRVHIVPDFAHGACEDAKCEKQDRQREARSRQRQQQRDPRIKPVVLPEDQRFYLLKANRLCL